MVAPTLPSRWIITPADNADDANVLPRVAARARDDAHQTIVSSVITLGPRVK